MIRCIRVAKWYFFKNCSLNEAGFVVSTELVLVTTILVIGMVVGHTTLRDRIVTELTDSADAISTLDQTSRTVTLSSEHTGVWQAPLFLTPPIFVTKAMVEFRGLLSLSLRDMCIDRWG